MYVIRDVFRCKPGKATAVAQKFQKTAASMSALDGFRNTRILVDVVAGYWTVVLESEVESLDQFEKHMAAFASRPEVRESLAGYMDMVDGGHREIFRIHISTV
jgi:heme-degrading monooxygenase HmoA